MEKFSLAIQKLVKFLKSQNQIKGMDKAEVFKGMIESSFSRQLIFGNSYKIYKDLSIEIPINFDEEVLEDFLIEVFFEQQMF